MYTQKPMAGAAPAITTPQPTWRRIIRFFLFLFTQFLPVITLTWLPAFIGTIKFSYNHPEIIFYDYHGQSVFEQFLYLRPSPNEVAWDLGFWGYVVLSIVLVVMANLYWVNIFNKANRLQWILLMCIVQFILASIVWFFASDWFYGSWFHFSPFLQGPGTGACC